jgi:hypothetical protein
MALMVVSDRNIQHTSIFPSEDDTPLLINPDTPESSQVTLQGL